MSPPPYGAAAAVPPLTLGTAGHIDHGKSALVRALTGVETDRLEEERRRGISIVLGYAPLALPSGRRVSVVDVPGHERFVRTMVAGATGIDCYMMVVAADDGVMPQTVEHATVLDALGVHDGVVAITKADVAAPERALAEARELLPRAAAFVPCSAVTGQGVADVAAALDAVAAGLPGRAGDDGDAVLHVDRAFTVDGIGTVVTGTLWSGRIARGDMMALLPGGREARVRSVQVHDVDVDAAEAGQRVAVALAGVRAREVARGDVLAAPGARSESTILDCALALRDDARHGERVHVHHGTREAPARLSDLGDGLWQLRLEAPLMAADGDRVVVRRLSPPDTLGGGTVLDARASKHGRRADVLARLVARRDGRPEPAAPVPAEAPAPPAAAAPAVAPEQRAAADALAAELRATLLLSEAQVDRAALALLREEGRAVRISGTLYADAAIADETRSKIMALIAERGSASLAEVRDALATGRKPAQAFLEHLDAQRVTRRLPDDRRVLR
ncbi:selenocysteine-specific translation elongation factor [Conexibacter woesei]|uniref:selenocysteine-specific translation elongation factor n=1 Tax=Conexibacter woesei TaxID=191495 RepID=UPI00042A115B|nr:selenocysteine-specific translation elongation factor [Conexibacter woesei]